jgi:F-type H+-transporting ATPase subunit delta
VKSLHAARSYAKALFELARERGQTDTVARELSGVVELIAGDAELQQFFAQPGVPAEAKRRVAQEIAQRLGTGTLTRDFLALAADHGRGDEIADILGAYRALVDAAAGRVRARVRSAIPLTDPERTALASRLGAALGKTVLVDEQVDATLLGGLVAEVGGLVADASLDAQLMRMKERLERG